MLKNIGLALLIFLMTANAYAGSQSGTVLRIFIRASDGLVYFELNGGNASGRAACAANTTYWMIKDETSNAGKQQLALLMEAKATGAVVNVTGAGTCTRWGDGEDVDNLVLQ